MTCRKERIDSKSDVRLEVGTAHRNGVDATIQLDNHRVITFPNRFIHAAPVGGAHL
jgi:hypothetical protein